MGVISIGGRSLQKAEGEIEKHVQAVAMPAWTIRLSERHEAYITWEEFLKNGERLEKNTNGEARTLSGPAREGLALLRGLLLCDHRGREPLPCATGATVAFILSMNV